MSAENRPPRWIALDGAVNARAVVPGVLIRADNLQSLSAQDVRWLVEREAVEVVLDLRTDVEVILEGPGPMTAERAVRIEYRSLHPDSETATELVAGTVRPWVSAAEQESPGESPEEALVVRAYMGYLRRRPDSVVASVRAIARADGAVLVHCAAGKDRTGVVVALALDAAGVERSAIVADYVATAERIGAVMERLVGSHTYREQFEGYDIRRHTPLAATMERLLELIDERFGGSVAWLSRHGLEDHDLERLGRRLAPARTGAERT